MRFHARIERGAVATYHQGDIHTIPRFGDDLRKNLTILRFHFRCAEIAMLASKSKHVKPKMRKARILLA
jgi:hypothetical protein